MRERLIGGGGYGNGASDSGGRNDFEELRAAGDGAEGLVDDCKVAAAGSWRGWQIRGEGQCWFRRKGMVR